MEAKTYYGKALSSDDHLFSVSRQVGNAIGNVIGNCLGHILWFVKDYARCFLLSYTMEFVPTRWRKHTAEDPATRERGLKYALATVMAMLATGCALKIYLLLLCH